MATSLKRDIRANAFKYGIQTLLVCLIGYGVAAGTFAQAETSALEEVIVTAQKRSQDVRDVPISISVISGSELAKSGIVDFDSLAAYLPNVSINTEFNSMYMRGIGTSELNVIAEQAISYVIDGVYLAKLEFLKPGFLDVERIEVLKGPQGTLFGRNATAGVINITTGIPATEFTFSASTSVGSRDALDHAFAISGPVSETLRLRVAGRKKRVEGHTINTDKNTRIGDKNSEKFRGKLDWDISDTISARFSLTTFDHFTGAWGGTEATLMPDDYSAQIALYDPDFEANFDRKGHANTTNISTGDGRIIPLELNIELWEHTFTSITALATLNDFVGGDMDGSNTPLVDLFANVEYEQITQEFRITSPPGVWEYQIGLFALQSEVYAFVDIPLVRGIDGASANALLGGLGSFGDLPTLPGTASQQDGMSGDFSIDVTSYSMFGQVGWNISDTVELILGGRYTDDKNVGSGETRGDGPVGNFTLDGGYKVVDEVMRDTNFSPKVSVTWDIFESVTAYATYAEGFRAGSFNIVALYEEAFRFDGEISTTYEAGFKNQFLDGALRLNIGWFKTVYDDYQIAVFDGFTTVSTNAEEVKSQGVEGDLTVLLLPGLVVNFNVGYNDAYFESNEFAACPAKAVSDGGEVSGAGAQGEPARCDLSGKDLHRAPRWTSSARLDYTRSWGDTELVLGADATFKDEEFLDADLDPLDHQGAYLLYNARLGIRAADGRWSLMLLMKNIENKMVKTYSGDIPLHPGAHWAMTNPPRSYSATLSVDF